VDRLYIYFSGVKGVIREGCGRCRRRELLEISILNIFIMIT